MTVGAELSSGASRRWRRDVDAYRSWLVAISRCRRCWRTLFGSLVVAVLLSASSSSAQAQVYWKASRSRLRASRRKCSRVSRSCLRRSCSACSRSRFCCSASFFFAVTAVLLHFTSVAIADSRYERVETYSFTQMGQGSSFR